MDRGLGGGEGSYTIPDLLIYPPSHPAFSFPHPSTMARKASSELDASSEMSLVVRVVCTTKLPTLTFDDNRRLRDLLANLFPGISITDR